MITRPHIRRLVILTALFTPLSGALGQSREPRPPAPGRAIVLSGAASGRGAMLGVTPRASTGAADTLGLLIEDVDENMPAARAGIRRGSRLVSIDGVNLRLDPADIGNGAAERIPEGRLRRLLADKAPGDPVTVVSLTDGRRETTQVTLAESPMARTIRTATTPFAGRRVLGLGFATRGSARDTAGLLITSITIGSAAEQAGLSEGDRLVSINGVDLRVPAADAGTPEATDARVARLRRTIESARDSEPVRLDVLSDGRIRSMSVTPTRERGWSFNSADMAALSGTLEATMRVGVDLAEATRAASIARAEVSRTRAQLQRDRASIERDAASVERDVASEERDRADAERNQVDVEFNVATTQLEMAGTALRDLAFPPHPPEAPTALRGRTDGATLSLAGITLAVVDRDFARQFGRGAEDGALVVRIRRDWDPIRAGDVLLSIDGRPVRTGDTLDVTIDRTRAMRVELLRNGRRQTITLPPSR